MSEYYDEHYVRSIVRMGDSRNVYTNQALFTSRKIKLIEKGVKVDSTLYDRLVSHKLIPKIDECLTVENSVTPDTLHDYAKSLLDNDDKIALLRCDERSIGKILNALREIPLVDPIAFKLTVARTQRPDVFEHSIRVAIAALHLAVNSLFFSQKELATLAAAAVFHDLGILHTPPELLEPGRILEMTERHHLYAHPLTAYLILKEYPEYYPDISRTVLEHHERLDGSGYPRALAADEICLGAQVLMLAEVTVAVLQKAPPAEALGRLSVLLRINRKKLNRELCHSMFHLVFGTHTGDDDGDDSGAERTAPADSGRFETQLSEIALVFRRWDEARTTLRKTEKKRAREPLPLLIGSRVHHLQRALHHAGLDLAHLSSLTEIVRECNGENDDVLGELALLVDETRWQLTQIVYETHRRMNDAEAANMPPTSVLGWLKDSSEILRIH